MNFKKTVAIAAAAGALAAISVPAMALENEFHGMYKFMGYQSNLFNGATVGLAAEPRSGFIAEQRARLQYTAKANADLKLVTHFELDTRFGGVSNYKGTTGSDSGNLDADSLTLETKNVYLDFNCPITGTNVKAGIQPWADSYQSLFLLADMSGVYATKKVGPVTGSLGWFRIDDNTALAANVGKLTTDLIVVDGKFALNKDMTVGASYYVAQNDTGVLPGAGPDLFELLHMVGVNADLKVGPASIKPFAAYQFGELNATDDISAFLLGATAKIKVGPGAVNLAAIYLSGDDNGTGDNDDFKTIATSNGQYFNAANMWLLIRSGQAVNSSTSVLGNDLTVGNRGLMGVFAGYEGTMGKVFYNANIGYAQTAEERGTEDGVIGTEVNAQVGYKLFDNLSASAAVAYAFLGNGLNSNTATDRFSAPTSADTSARLGAADADDPYMINLQLAYAF
jgi:hypothetical protein